MQCRKDKKDISIITGKVQKIATQHVQFKNLTKGIKEPKVCNF